MTVEKDLGKYDMCIWTRLATVMLIAKHDVVALCEYGWPVRVFGLFFGGPLESTRNKQFHYVLS